MSDANALVRQWWPMAKLVARRVAKKRSKRDLDAADLEQAALLVVPAVVARHDVEKGANLKTYMMSCMTYAAINEARRVNNCRTQKGQAAARRVSLDGLRDRCQRQLHLPDRPTGAIEALEAVEYLNWLVGKLEPVDQDLVRWYWLDGEPCESIGARIGLTKTGVRLRLRRILGDMKYVAGVSQFGKPTRLNGRASA
jgi:RNA polymerase sigma factor (sigma-70 family)